MGWRLGILLGLIVGFLFTWFLVWTLVRADHNVYLPGVPNTPFMQTILNTGEITWCLDNRARNYANFRTQLIDVLEDYEREFGVFFREVPLDNTCQFRHVMPDNSFCSGCAANITYASWPVVVQYKWQLGYGDWRSAHGHEAGHAFGLHEQYKDSGGIGCDTSYNGMIQRLGFETVMCCGTLVRYATDVDTSRVCSLVSDAFTGCQPVPPPTPVPPTPIPPTATTVPTATPTATPTPTSTPTMEATESPTAVASPSSEPSTPQASPSGTSLAPTPTPTDGGSGGSDSVNVAVILAIVLGGALFFIIVVSKRGTTL